MKIVFKKPKLLEDYLKAIVRCNDTNQIDISDIVNKIKMYIYKIDDFELLQDNNINNGVFYALLSDLAKIELEKKDYLKILSENNDIKYDRIIDIKTTMLEHRKIATRRIYKVFVSEKEKLRNNELLYKNELKEKIENKSIVLISKKYLFNDIHKYDKIESTTEFDLTPFEAFMYDNELSKTTKKYIRDNISKEYINKEYEDYIRILKDEIDHIINFNSVMNNSKKISNRLSEELNNTEYIKRLK